MGDGASGMRLVLTGVLLAIVVGGAMDLMLDAPEDWRSGHVLYELGLIAGGLVWCALALARLVARGGSAGSLQRTLAERQAERDAWRRRVRRGPSRAGPGRWANSSGSGSLPRRRGKSRCCSSRGRAQGDRAATGRSERTVRQHAVALYHKAGVGGRAELAAFFLGDLVLPPATVDPSRS